ncbi:unnamed protein product [Musa acuminata subsp. malaccensis]|uniref:(wild Malaysian banana) hypothetical protein n=1 Tax=Musa acuminata subsp. malaccensis TaxID=214687 RepID=A0A8D7F2A2_MUSAM|nr:unnamed protein product [Musa acuminata subsp. malaccensis]
MLGCCGRLLLDVGTHLIETLTPSFGSGSTSRPSASVVSAPSPVI